MQERVDDYQKFGVENIWVIDPATRRGYDYKPGAIFEVLEFGVANTPIKLVLADIFADLINTNPLTRRARALLFLRANADADDRLSCPPSGPVLITVR